jgi:hypothetical protein
MRERAGGEKVEKAASASARSQKTYCWLMGGAFRMMATLWPRGQYI